MDRLIAPNSVPSGQADTAPVSGTPQFATSGSPGGHAPTVFPAYAWNAIQEEILAVVAAAGIGFDRTNNAQLSAAIAKLILISQGSYRGLNFQAANYTTTTTDTGKIVELAGTATGNATFKVIDGVNVGDAQGFVNQSNFNLTIQINTGSAAEFIGVGVPLGTSFVIAPGGNAEIIWGGINWRVNNFSGAFAGVGTIGSMGGLSFQSGNYTTQASDIGTVLQLAASATGPATFKIADGTFTGATLELVNQSNYPLTIQINTGSTANFIGIGVPLGTSFVIPAGGGATITWGSVNWRVTAFFANFSASGTLTATSGYEIHSDGTIEQWGTGTLVAGTATVTWPIAFPTGAYRASFIANTTANAVAATGPTMAQTSSVNATGGTVFGASGATNTFSYRVKGY